MSAIRVAIADDQQLFCSGIQMLIESQPDLQFVGAAHDGEAAVTLAGQARPDVMLMDIRMPLLDGIAATARILADTEKREAHPKVIMLTTFQRDEAVVRAIHAGADGFIMKDTTPEFVLASIRTVHAGHSVIAPSDTADIIRSQASQHHREPVAESITLLSARERGLPARSARTQQRRHRPDRLHQRGDGQESHPKHPGEAVAHLTRSDRGARLRERTTALSSAPCFGAPD